MAMLFLEQSGCIFGVAYLIDRHHRSICLIFGVSAVVLVLMQSRLFFLTTTFYCHVCQLGLGLFGVFCWALIPWGFIFFVFDRFISAISNISSNLLFDSTCNGLM